MTHVAFLRAVNVGGRGVVKMSDVRAAFEEAGCRNVRTFIASGNVVFESAKLTRPLTTRVHAAMRELLGARPGICYRTLDHLEGLIAARPFGELIDDAAVKLYVAFTDRAPQIVPALPVVIEKEAIEITAVRGSEMFVVSRRKPNGMYGFPNLFVEQLGVVATTRNWNTVTRLAVFGRT